MARWRPRPASRSRGGPPGPIQRPFRPRHRRFAVEPVSRRGHAKRNDLMAEDMASGHGAEALLRKVRKKEDAPGQRAAQCLSSVPHADHTHGAVKEVSVGMGERFPVRGSSLGANPLKDRHEIKPRYRLVVFRFCADMPYKRAKTPAEAGSTWGEFRIVEIDPGQANVIIVPKRTPWNPQGLERGQEFGIAHCGSLHGEKFLRSRASNETAAANTLSPVGRMPRDRCAAMAPARSNRRTTVPT